MWTIWRSRNEFIFLSKILILEECFDTTKKKDFLEVVDGEKKGWDMYLL
jgi:hypothetical protein